MWSRIVHSCQPTQVIMYVYNYCVAFSVATQGVQRTVVAPLCRPAYYMVNKGYRSSPREMESTYHPTPPNPHPSIDFSRIILNTNVSVTLKVVIATHARDGAMTALRRTHCVPVTLRACVILYKHI